MEDADAAVHVRQGDVDELVKTAGAGDGVVQDVGAVGGADDEHRLTGADTVHLRQDLVDHAVRRLAAPATAATASLRNGRVRQAGRRMYIRGDVVSGEKGERDTYPSLGGGCM